MRRLLALHMVAALVLGGTPLYAQMPGMKVEEPDTNLVFFDPAGTGVAAAELVKRMRLEGVQLSILGGRIRACTHLDITRPMIRDSSGISASTSATEK